MTHGSLFSGIGGFDLAAQWMGWENVFHCEYDPFCQKVLAHHFPNSKLHEDVTTFDATAYAGRIDIISGGFPCQPFSTAGKRKGTEDPRHLWPSMLRIIREVQPRYVVGENVRGILNWSDGLVFEQVCSDLEAEGYEVRPFILPACGVNAPHRRDRVWFVAYANDCDDRRTAGKDEGAGGEEWVQKRDEVRQSTEPSEIFGLTTNARCKRQQRGSQGQRTQGGKESKHKQPKGCNELQVPNFEVFPSFDPLCRGDDGLPKELDGITFSKWRGQSLKAYGNAIVPQVAHQIFKAIHESEILLR